MPITVGLILERDEYDELAGILKMNGLKVSPTLTECLRREAATLRGKTRDKLESFDDQAVRTDVQTHAKLSRKQAATTPKGR